MMDDGSKAIDEFLDTVSSEQRTALEHLRETIRAEAPDAEEGISYRLPAFRLHGRPLVAFGASKNHCSFYPMDGSTVKAFKEKLKDFETSKGTIRFQPGSPIPDELVRKIVRSRIEDLEG